MVVVRVTLPIYTVLDKLYHIGNIVIEIYYIAGT